MRVKIEKGIPIPKKGGKKEILLSMEAGDSFRVERAESVAWKSSANNYSDENRKFSVRRYGDAYRLWRIQ